MDERLAAQLQTRAAAMTSDVDPAHDFSHVMRVVRAASIIGRAEGADLDVTVAAALLHELVNLPKADPNSSRSGDLCADAAAMLLEEHGAAAAFTSAVCDCIRVHSFSAGLVPTNIEGRILQDADRLDAIGAIGIARCFATCATMHRPFYAASDPFCEHRSPDDKRWGIDHFYRKLLKIPELLHTTTAKEIARARAAFTLQFLEQLRSEILL